MKLHTKTLTIIMIGLLSFPLYAQSLTPQDEADILLIEAPQVLKVANMCLDAGYEGMQLENCTVDGWELLAYRGNGFSQIMLVNYYKDVGNDKKANFWKKAALKNPNISNSKKRDL